MTHWQFLLQKDGDQAWLPLEASNTEILEGRYRAAVQSTYLNQSVTVQVAYIDTQLSPPRRRSQTRHSCTTPTGLLVIFPYSFLRPGIWQIICTGTAPARVQPQTWQYQLQLRVLAETDAALSALAGRSDWDSEDNASDLEDPDRTADRVESIAVQTTEVITPSEVSLRASESEADLPDFEVTDPLAESIPTNPIPLASASSEPEDCSEYSDFEDLEAEFGPQPDEPDLESDLDLDLLNLNDDADREPEQTQAAEIAVDRADFEDPAPDLNIESDFLTEVSTPDFSAADNREPDLELETLDLNEAMPEEPDWVDLTADFSEPDESGSSIAFEGQETDPISDNSDSDNLKLDVALDDDLFDPLPTIAEETFELESEPPNSELVDLDDSVATAAKLSGLEAESDPYPFGALHLAEDASISAAPAADPPNPFDLERDELSTARLEELEPAEAQVDASMDELDDVSSDVELDRWLGNLLDELPSADAEATLTSAIASPLERLNLPSTDLPEVDLLAGSAIPELLTQEEQIHSDPGLDDLERTDSSTTSSVAAPKAAEADRKQQALPKTASEVRSTLSLDELKALQHSIGLSLETYHYTANWQSALTIRGQITQQPSTANSDQPKAQMSAQPLNQPWAGQIRVLVRNPQNMESLASEWQALTIPPSGCAFASSLMLPDQAPTHLLLGEVTLYAAQAAENPTPVALASQTFSVTADVPNLLAALNEWSSTIRQRINDPSSAMNPASGWTTPGTAASVAPDLQLLNLVSPPPRDVEDPETSDPIEPARVDFPLPPQLYQPETKKIAHRQIELPQVRTVGEGPLDTIVDPWQAPSNHPQPVAPDLTASSEQDQPSAAAAAEFARIAQELPAPEAANLAHENFQISAADLEELTRFDQEIIASSAESFETGFASNLDQVISLDEPAQHQAAGAGEDEAIAALLDIDLDDAHLDELGPAIAPPSASSPPTIPSANLPHSTEPRQPVVPPSPKIAPPASADQHLSQEVVLHEEAPLPPRSRYYPPSRPRSYTRTPLIPEHVEIPTPELEVLVDELIAGRSFVARVTLPQLPYQIYVKLWVSDRQSRLILDGPHWLTHFVALPTDRQEASLVLTAPYGTLQVQISAIAVEFPSKRESQKASCDRPVLPPELPNPTIEGLET